MIIFLALPLITGILLDVFISTNLKKSLTFAADEIPVWNDIYNGRINSDIIINGSSRALVHFDADKMSRELNTSVYNIGDDGNNFDIQGLRCKVLLKYNRQPKVIIQSIDLAMFNKINYMFMPTQILPYMLWDWDMMQVCKHKSPYDAADFVIPFKRYYGQHDVLRNAISIFRHRRPEHVARIKGYRATDGTWEQDLAAEKVKMANFKFGIDSDMVKNFDQFIIDCRRRNIKLIFVNTPEYIGGRTLVKNRAEIMSVFKSLVTKYRIPFFDYSNHPISYNQKYFYNTVHLNRGGSQYFTQNFIDTLKKTRVLDSLLAR